MKRRSSDIDRTKQAFVLCLAIVAIGLVIKLSGL